MFSWLSPQWCIVVAKHFITYLKETENLDSVCWLCMVAAQRRNDTFDALEEDQKIYAQSFWRQCKVDLRCLFCPAPLAVPIEEPLEYHPCLWFCSGEIRFNRKFLIQRANDMYEKLLDVTGFGSMFDVLGLDLREDFTFLSLVLKQKPSD